MKRPNDHRIRQLFSPGLVVLALAWLGAALPGAAQIVTLVNNNSIAQINTSSSAGLFNWNVDGTNQLIQQWFWFRTGTTPEAPINTISAPTITTPNARTLSTAYNNGRFGVSVDYKLTGYSAGSGISDMAETITITNATASPLEFHFFQYSDFDLGGTPAGDTVQLGRDLFGRFNEALQTQGALFTETDVTPGADHGEANFFNATLVKLNNGNPDILNDNAGPVGPGDVTWALQWDFIIPAGSSVGINVNKYVQLQTATNVITLSDISLAPVNATNDVGTAHTVCATISTVSNGVTNPVVGTTVTFNVTNGPNATVHGTSVTGSNGIACFTYVGTGGVGTDLIDVSFAASDGNRHSATAFKVWVVANHCPIADSLSLAVNQDAQVTTNLPASDPDGDPLQYLIALPPSHGFVALQIQTGVCSYTPNHGYCGPDSFKYKVNDGHCDSAEATVVINVVDTTPPQVTCPGDMTVQTTNAAGAVVNYTAFASDLCGLADFHCSPPSGTVFPIGTTTPVCTAVDASGNSNSCSFQVTVLGARGIKQDCLTNLVALRAGVTNRHDGEELDDAIAHLAKSLDPALWIDQTHVQRKGGEKVFEEEKKAAHELVELLKDKKSTVADAALHGLIDCILRADRLLAVVAVDEAEAAGVKPKKIAEDRKEIAKGDEDAAEGEYEEAIDHYRNAWKHAIHIQIAPPHHLATGGVRLGFIGLEGETYVIQASADLVHWTTIGTARANADGEVALDDPEASQQAARFYRVVSP